MASPEYGTGLPDQADRLFTVFDAHIELVGDLRDLYRDRAALEREYAVKLQALAKRAEEKKQKLSPRFIVGEDPTKGWDASTLSRSTLETAFSKIISSVGERAQDHIDIADALTNQVVTPLKAIDRQQLESKKKIVQFYQKTLADRDRIYNERIKTKQKYDEECGEVEVHRQKQTRAHDDRHAERALKHAEQQRTEMLNNKNIYIISTSVANKTKAKFYAEDLPALQNELQSLQSYLIKKFTKILIQGQALQIAQLDAMKNRLSSIEKSLEAVDPAKDQALFIDYNVRPFSLPGDWSFEPCSSHYDTGDISLEPAPKVFLQNKLSQNRMKLGEMMPLLQSKRKELEQLSRLMTAYSENQSLGKVEEIIDTYLEIKHQVMSYSTSECILETENDVISAALGGDEGSQQPHTFKSATFSIPTPCSCCKSSIWGLSTKGKTCKACGISVHAKCELKMPANCSAFAGDHSLTRKATSASILSTRSEKASVTPSSFVSSAMPEEHEETYPAARMIFDFQATSEFELTISEGAEVEVIEPDDGSGWVKVRTVGRGVRKSGLVPATYIEFGQEGQPVPQQEKAARVRAIYEYTSQGSDELPLREGEVIHLTEGPNGGKNYADGWWEGMNSQGRKGIFPSNYVEAL